MTIDPILIKKYNQPIPRYTSYPTVPFWQPGLDVEEWQHRFTATFDKHNTAAGISLYIHLPFCESLAPIAAAIKRLPPTIPLKSYT